MTENLALDAQPIHDCGLCDAPIVFDGLSGETSTWRCTKCEWWHISTDCCA